MAAANDAVAVEVAAAAAVLGLMATLARRNLSKCEGRDTEHFNAHVRLRARLEFEAAAAAAAAAPSAAVALLYSSEKEEQLSALNRGDALTSVKAKSSHAAHASGSRSRHVRSTVLLPAPSTVGAPTTAHAGAHPSAPEPSTTTLVAAAVAVDGAAKAT